MTRLTWSSAKKLSCFSPGRTSLCITGSGASLSDTPRLPQTLGKMTLWLSGLTSELYRWHKECLYGISHFSLHRIRTRREMSITATRTLPSKEAASSINKTSDFLLWDINRVRKLGDFQERWDFHLIKIIWKSKAWSSQKSLIKFCFKRSTAMVKCCSP